MTDSATFLLSNLASAIFIDLTVPADTDVLQAAREHLQQTQLPTEVQQGFFVSVYPTGTPADTGDQYPATGPAGPPPRDAPDASHEVSPLDEAAAQGPMGLDRG